MDPVCQAHQKTRSFPTTIPPYHYAGKMGRKDATQRSARSGKMLQHRKHSEKGSFSGLVTL
jgi:hypothetical protein